MTRVSLTTLSLLFFLQFTGSILSLHPNRRLSSKLLSDSLEIQLAVELAPTNSDKPQILKEDPNAISTNTTTTPIPYLPTKVQNYIISPRTLPYIDELRMHSAEFAIGLIISLFSILLLWFNERRAYRLTQLRKTTKAVISELSTASLDHELNGELIIAKGELKTPHPVTDKLSGLTIENCVKLRRNVEVFQMTEHKTEGKFAYSPSWSSKQINSLEFNDVYFKFQNEKVSFPVDSATRYGDFVQLGFYSLNRNQLSSLERWKPVILDNDFVLRLKPRFKAKLLEIKQRATDSDPEIILKDNYVIVQQYFAKDTIGDLRISYDYVPCQKVTFVCSVSGSSFIPYDNLDKKLKKTIRNEDGTEKLIAGGQDSNGRGFDICLDVSCCCSYWFRGAKSDFTVEEKIDWVYEEELLTSDEVFDRKIEAYGAWSNPLRILGIFLIIFGCYLIFSPIVGVFGVTESMGASGTPAQVIVPAAFGILLGFFVMSFAWIVYCFWTSLLIMAGTVGCILLLFLSH